MLKQFAEKFRIFLAYPASAKFALSRRLYNLIVPALPGKRVKCNICGWEGYRFLAIAGVTYIRYNAICGGCGSVDRHRALVEYMQRRGDFNGKGGRCLDMGPIPRFKAYFETRGYDYVSMDLESNVAMVKMDITRLGFVDNTFDLIICSHVLEHVKDDLQAIREMFKVLKSGGICYILVPFDGERTSTIEYERPNLLDPVHVRAYGLDVVDRIQSMGFGVETVDLVSGLDSNDVKKYGLAPQEICFVCTKIRLN